MRCCIDSATVPSIHYYPPHPFVLSSIQNVGRVTFLFPVSVVAWSYSFRRCTATEEFCVLMKQRDDARENDGTRKGRVHSFR